MAFDFSAFLTERDSDKPVLRHENALYADLQDLANWADAIDLEVATETIEKVDLIDALVGAEVNDEIFTATDVCGALDELAGAERTTETVKDAWDIADGAIQDGSGVITPAHILLEGEGCLMASDISITDEASRFTGEDIEAALQELAGADRTDETVMSAYTLADAALVDDTDVINSTHIDWGTGQDQISAVDVPIADGETLFATDNVEAALAEAMADLNTAEEDILDLAGDGRTDETVKDNADEIALIKTGEIAEVFESTDTDTQMGLPVVFIKNIESGAAVIEIFDADASFDFEITGMDVQARATVTSGTVQLLDNSSNPITDVVVCTADKAITHAVSIDDAYSLVKLGDSLTIECTADGQTVGDLQGLIVIHAIKRLVNQA